MDPENRSDTAPAAAFHEFGTKSGVQLRSQLQQPEPVVTPARRPSVNLLPEPVSNRGAMTVMRAASHLPMERAIHTRQLQLGNGLVRALETLVELQRGGK